ncbi:hypothetical protein V5799_029507 [Amblyomma americanum]|uniref:Uncharacterized protein n=1 Tax=Amblyomma americanum TaxID=6943 RepID=A0AAQ4ERA1_AMBAM
MPTLEENDRFELSPREAELAGRVCEENCVVALAAPEQRRQLCLTTIQCVRPALTIIVGQRIAEDEDFLDYLQILLPDEVRVVPSVSSWPRDGYEGVCLVEPDVLWTLLTNGDVTTNDPDVLILRDFEHYLDSGHAYRKIVACFQEALGQKSCPLTRFLAIADELQVSSLDGLENDLKRLRTPIKLTCCIGTPVRPHSKDAAIEVCFLQMDWSAQVGDIVASSDDPEVQEVGTTLRERGVVAARCQAEKMHAAKPRADLEHFLRQSQTLLTRAKINALLDRAQGKTVALTSTVSFQRELKGCLQGRESVRVIDGLHDLDQEPVCVLVATTADIPTVQLYQWDAVVFCDLPFGVSCHALLAKANRSVALATQPDWKKWKEALDLHDDLERLLQRVNE